MYQGLLLNSSKMALRGEIVMSLGTKWNRLPVQIHSEINTVHSWSLWFLLTSSLVCHFPPSPPPCHISWECQMQVELNFPFILCFYLETEWGTLYLHRCAFSSAYVGSHQESCFKHPVLAEFLSSGLSCCTVPMGCKCYRLYVAKRTSNFLTAPWCTSNSRWWLIIRFYLLGSQYIIRVWKQMKGREIMEKKAAKML